MKKIILHILLIVFCISSFYITEKVALHVKMNTPIIKDINKVKDSKYIDYINCTLIDDNYIIPGLNGKEINVDKSFKQMKIESVFNEDLLVYNQVSPTNSLEDNKNRIIIRGNKQKNSVSLIFEDDCNLAKYMFQNGYLINILINKEVYSNKYEIINNAQSKEIYNNIEKYLNKNKINKKLCHYNNQNCTNSYLFKPSIILNHSNLSTNIKNITSGEIILVENTLTLEELNLLIKQIEYRSLNIIPLSELISEIN